jgi:N-acetylated-alpha-linked acidic dipeptidase
VPPLPTLAVAAELKAMPQDLRRFGEVELMRGQNRFVAALRAAAALVEGAMQ